MRAASMRASFAARQLGRLFDGTLPHETPPCPRYERRPTACHTIDATNQWRPPVSSGARRTPAITPHHGNGPRISATTTNPEPNIGKPDTHRYSSTFRRNAYTG